MDKLRLTTKGMELKVEGSAELIERERGAFFSYLAEKEREGAEAMREFAEKITLRRPARMKKHPKGDCDNQKSPVLKKTEKRLTSWEAIKEAVDNGTHELHIGDVIEETLINGENVDLVVVDAGEDYVRFESRDCVCSKKVAWNENDNSGGFSRSDVKKYLDNTIWEMLPEALKSVISETERKQKNGDEVETYTARLFLPAASEVFEDEDDCYGDEGVYEPLEYYKDRRNRMKGERKGKDTCSWWLASVRSGVPYYACCVSYDGSAYYYNVDYPYVGVPLCFQIQKS